MHTVYCSNADLSAPSFKLSDREELHHLKNVLRIKSGEEVHLINDKNQTAVATIEGISKNSVEIRIKAFQENKISKPYLILACAVPKKSKFEVIVEKATELGIDEIIPLITERTEVKLPAQNKKEDRYQTVMINAVKQCKRTTIPSIRPVQKFSETLKELLLRGIVIMPSLEGTRTPLIESLPKTAPEVISILIGPEGDFTSLEYNTAHTSGVLAVSLGETILRVETAAITVVSALKYFYYK